MMTALAAGAQASLSNVPVRLRHNCASCAIIQSLCSMLVALQAYGHLSQTLADVCRRGGRSLPNVDPLSLTGQDDGDTRSHNTSCSSGMLRRCAFNSARAASARRFYRTFDKRADVRVAIMNGPGAAVEVLATTQNLLQQSLRADAD